MYSLRPRICSFTSTPLSVLAGIKIPNPAIMRADTIKAGPKTNPNTEFIKAPNREESPIPTSATTPAIAIYLPIVFATFCLK
jgi:hypothetical protein